MRSLQKIRATIEEYSYLYPAIADQVMDVFTTRSNSLDATGEDTGERSRYSSPSQIDDKSDHQDIAG